MENPLILKMSTRDGLSEIEKQELLSAPQRLREFRKGQDLVSEGSQPTESCLLLHGFAARYNVLRASGEKNESRVLKVGKA